jgi:glutathione S-transferase
MSLRLYDFELDQNAYKVRMLLAFLRIDYTKVAMNVFPGSDHKSDAYLRLSPVGELPALEDGEVMLFQPEAILVYIARTYDRLRTWLPDDPAQLGAITQWLAFAAHQLRDAGAARSSALFGTPLDEEKTLASVREAFRILEAHLTGRLLENKLWLVSDHPTIADLAVFPAFALSRDFGIEHGEFPALRRWSRALRNLPDFIPMPGVPDYH